MPDSDDAPKKKDFWDKLGAVGPLAVGLFISTLGSWATYSYNQRQIRVQQVQTVEGFMEYLLGDEESQRLAIIAISSLGNSQLAVELAGLYKTPGTTSALVAISATGDEEAQALANSALQAAADRRQKLVEDMFDENGQTRRSATAELVRNWTSDPSIIELVLEQGREKGVANSSGRINTLFVLERIDVQLLGEYREDVENLLVLFSVAGGTQTLTSIGTLRGRLSGSEVVPALAR